MSAGAKKKHRRAVIELAEERPRLSYRKRCKETGKKRYPSKVNALTALSTACRSLGVQRAYECPACGDWHLTKMPKAQP